VVDEVEAGKRNFGAAYGNVCLEDDRKYCLFELVQNNAEPEFSQEQQTCRTEVVGRHVRTPAMTSDLPENADFFGRTT